MFRIAPLYQSINTLAGHPAPFKEAGMRTKASTAQFLVVAILVLAAKPAAAQVIAQMGAEIFSWQAVFDTNFIPIAITVGLIAALLFGMFNRLVGIVTFVAVVLGACAYGARELIIALAGA
jgi:hypothetical protein